MHRVEAPDGLLPAELAAFLPDYKRAETAKPFIGTQRGIACYDLLNRKVRELWERKKRELAEILVSDDEIQLRWDERLSPYGKEEQYKGVALRPNPKGGVDVCYTWLGGNDEQPATDWIIYRPGVSVRNGISETLRAAGMLLDLSGIGRETTLSEHVDTAMMFAWHHPHDFHDGPLDPKR